MTDWDVRIRALGVELLDPTPAQGMYTPVLVHERVAYTSGAVAMEGRPLQVAHVGCVGEDLTLEEARLSARGAMLVTLANLRGALGGNLNRIERFLKITGFVRAAPSFHQLPQVLDGASELLVEIFGEDRRSARSTVGVAALPSGASVELEALVALRE